MVLQLNNWLWRDREASSNDALFRFNVEYNS